VGLPGAISGEFKIFQRLPLHLQGRMVKISAGYGPDIPSRAANSLRPRTADGVVHAVLRQVGEEVGRRRLVVGDLLPRGA